VHTSTTRVAARFIFISDSRPQSSWQDGSRSDRQRVGWRVIAANNRPLGRSARVFDSYALAVNDAAALRSHVDGLTSTVTLDASAGHWSWQCRFNGLDVACCVHEYKRRVECARSLEHFLLAVRAADPHQAELRHFGPNALRAYPGPEDPAVHRRLTPVLRPASR